MNDKQFNDLCKRLDKIFGILAVQNIDDKNDKIYALKKFGFTSEEISTLIGVKNVRQMEGWKRK